MNKTASPNRFLEQLRAGLHDDSLHRLVELAEALVPSVANPTPFVLLHLFFNETLRWTEGGPDAAVLRELERRIVAPAAEAVESGTLDAIGRLARALFDALDLLPALRAQA